MFLEDLFGSFGVLAAVKGQVVISTVVSQNNEEVRRLLGHDREGEDRQEKQSGYRFHTFRLDKIPQ